MPHQASQYSPLPGRLGPLCLATIDRHAWQPGEARPHTGTQAHDVENSTHASACKRALTASGTKRVSNMMVSILWMATGSSPFCTS